MNDLLNKLLYELDENTKSLLLLVEKEDVDAALVIVATRLQLMDSLKQMALQDDSIKSIIEKSLITYPEIEAKLIDKISSQKDIVAERLLQFDRMSKAEQAYRNII